MLLRLPYEDDGSRVDGFCFREAATDPDRTQYLWGNAAYAFGAVLIRAFGESGWLANIRGVQRDVAAEELVDRAARSLLLHRQPRRGLPSAPPTSSSPTPWNRSWPTWGSFRCATVKDTEFSAFYTNQSVQAPKRYDDSAATMNARFSAMLQNILCVSRFAHYLKILARDKIGAFVEAEECEDYLQRWLVQYVAADTEASAPGEGRVSVARGERAGAHRIPANPAATFASLISGRTPSWTDFRPPSG